MPETLAAQAREARLVQLIVFVLGEEEFAVPIEEVREIIRFSPVTPVPEAPGFIEGVLNVRGEIAAVIDLKARFGLPAPRPAAPAKHIIISEQGKNLFGLKVDEVTEVLRLPRAQIQPAPEVVTRSHGDYVAGVIPLGSRLVVLLDLVRVLSGEELAKMAEVRRRQEPGGRPPKAGRGEERAGVPSQEAAEEPVKSQTGAPPGLAEPERRRKRRRLNP